MQRSDGRAPDEIRPINFELNVAPHASGSVLVSLGKTCVICAVMIEEGVPRWMKEQGVTGGWLTAEYSMLPYSTQPRKPRDITKGRVDGRSVEIQRLIGRSLRAAIDLEKLGPRTVWVDCDVLQADGGTRTTAITGASRDSDLPDIPTLAESGYPAVTSTSGTGIVAPAGIPPEIVARLNSKLNELIERRETQAKMKSFGLVPKSGPPEEFGAWAAQERQRWTRVVRESGAKAGSPPR